MSPSSANSNRARQMAVKLHGLQWLALADPLPSSWASCPWLFVPQLTGPVLLKCHAAGPERESRTDPARIAEIIIFLFSPSKAGLLLRAGRRAVLADAGALISGEHRRLDETFKSGLLQPLACGSAGVFIFSIPLSFCSQCLGYRRRSSDR